MSLIQKLFGLLRKIFPIIGLISPLLGVFFCILLNHYDYLSKMFYITFPFFIASLYLILSKNHEFSVKYIICYSSNKKMIFTVFILFYVLSIISLRFNNTRPWYYFILISLLYGIVAIQIFSKDYNKYIILFCIILINFNLIYSVLINYPFYFYSTDTIIHLNLAEVTKIFGHIIPTELDYDYSKFPLYHIYLAESSLISNINVYLTHGVISIILSLLPILIVYKIMELISHSTQMSLLCSLFFSFNPTILSQETNLIPLNFAFIGFILILYILIKVYLSRYIGRKLEIQMLLIILFFYTVIVHHVSIFIIFSLLFILAISVYIVTENFPKNYTKMFFIFVTITISYWIFTSSDLIRLLNLIFSSAVSAEGLSITIITETTTIANSFLLFFSNHLDLPLYSLFIFIGIGILYYKKNSGKLAVIFAFMTMILFSIFYTNANTNNVWCSKSIEDRPVHLFCHAIYYNYTHFWVFFLFTECFAK